ncbi:regulatory protein, tetR family [Amycolatopsis saalfeldensis]|uniref:Regulatory protein, tetR family n=2 Tax=Amycolatopsis saalfeldensis TaxID=394193 RepID=A0A1H8YK11_9PSEU|nr:regulatory protein, tetR family [Amycolatopsis saalfeldensis]
MSLRERKKRAARKALASTALRLAMERGMDQLRVEDIASEVGVSPRTFNNYFASKEQAVCSFIVERQERIRDALLERPADEPLWDAIINATAVQHLREEQPRREDVHRIREMLHNHGLFGEMLRAHADSERLLADALAERAGEGTNPLHACMLAGIVQSASRIAFQTWMQSEDEHSLLPIFVELLREAAAGMPELTAVAAGATAPAS